MKIALLIFLLFPLRSLCQMSKELQSLVDSERSFARTSKETSTRQAFISFLADSALIFRDGPVLGKKFWQEAKDGSDLLTWEPVFADISSAGDMGYTTGPWEFRSQRGDVNAAAHGYFVSVWKKEKSQWKVDLDIGISYPATSIKETPRFVVQNGSAEKLTSSESPRKDLMNAELDFIRMQTEKGWKSCTEYFITDARIYRPGQFPFIDGERKKQIFAGTDKSLTYEPVGTGVSSSNDLAYVYGTAIFSNVSTSAPTKADYLRIWKLENGVWKIVLDLINAAR